MAKILLADDEEEIQRIVSWYLESEGFQVLVAQDGHSALELEEMHQPDLLILDIMMPGMSGWEVARAITRTVPIIFLTALDHENDKITGFNLGADDYITKPFSPRELLARVKVVLRRNGKLPLKSDILHFPALSIDPGTQSIRVNEERVDLSAKEFALLLFLARHPQDIFTREQLLVNIWGYDFDGDERTVDTTVKRIRQKMGSTRNYLRTIRDSGYKFEVNS
ncbi:transcriptional regulatory protein c terminal [Lucifera butyrica]|uniref:Transcriptional regulatory protein c terminal n=1 Tax=Lucifera butyrica TaxID=1351585 RepID=A0A498R9Y6_9FIRM|nr:response regulator transcription factor [Lucifera butyrica]VBB09506.1 transcriptional regulatory protein c terminal [Lucifera butyrica]